MQAQLDRIKLLADLDQYDSARLELREGAALGLRRDLRGAEEDYIAIKGEVRFFDSNELRYSMRFRSWPIQSRLAVAHAAVWCADGEGGSQLD